ncbi:apomucin-like isoform X1 [Hemicordylus capensis]|uniref:apomucin-like isoform X1 n=1 Tax=Hemicordylus capensis TaxID=884348 RepID=UPI002302E7EC|nr:apomucin-like isoform X1 [Hemicordylus capensis]
MTRGTGEAVTEYTEGTPESLATATISTTGRRPGECPTVPESGSCRFKNKYHKIGETFNDPDNPCLHYTCTVGGFTTEIEECPGQNWCSNESRLYHVDKCCYDCVNRCQPTPVRIQVSANGCKGYITMAKCIGDCKKETMFDDIDRKVVNECLCCQPKEHEIKSIPIFCPGGRSEVYTYKHTVSCSCQACGP